MVEIVTLSGVLRQYFLWKFVYLKKKLFLFKKKKSCVFVGLFVVPFWKVASFHTKFFIFLIKSFIQNPVFLYKTLSFYEILPFGTKFRLDTKFRLFISNYVFFSCESISIYIKLNLLIAKFCHFIAKFCHFIAKFRP